MTPTTDIARCLESTTRNTAQLSALLYAFQRLRISLSLAASGGSSVGRDACRLAVSNHMANARGGKTPAGFTDSRDLLILHLHKRGRSPAAALRHRLLVRGEVEGEEEEQVRRDDADARNGGELLARAFAHVGHVRPVGAGEVGPGGEVDEACKLLEWNINEYRE